MKTVDYANLQIACHQNINMTCGNLLWCNGLASFTSISCLCLDNAHQLTWLFAISPVMPLLPGSCLCQCLCICLCLQKLNMTCGDQSILLFLSARFMYSPLLPQILLRLPLVSKGWHTIHTLNIARGTTDAGYWVRNLNDLFQPKWFQIDFSQKHDSSYRLNTLGPLCLWQCLLISFNLGEDEVLEMNTTSQNHFIWRCGLV